MSGRTIVDSRQKIIWQQSRLQDGVLPPWSQGPGCQRCCMAFSRGESEQPEVVAHVGTNYMDRKKDDILQNV